jgi:hypothetical protein
MQEARVQKYKCDIRQYKKNLKCSCMQEKKSWIVIMPIAPPLVGFNTFWNGFLARGTPSGTTTTIHTIGATSEVKFDGGSKWILN